MQGMDEKMECKSVCLSDNMLKHLRSMYFSTHISRYRSSFVPVIVSGKEYPKGTLSKIKVLYLLWEKGGFIGVEGPGFILIIFYKLIIEFILKKINLNLFIYFIIFFMTLRLWARYKSEARYNQPKLVNEAWHGIFFLCF